LYLYRSLQSVVLLCFLFVGDFISQPASHNRLSSPQMFSIRSIFQLPFFAAASVSSHGNPKIQWGPCNATEVNSTASIVCGNLNVLLDYTEPSSNATLTLQLVRVSAALQPSKGSILFNFGGPGATGRGSLGLLGPALSA
jgi:hypothetical protein